MSSASLWAVKSALKFRCQRTMKASNTNTLSIESDLPSPGTHTRTQYVNGSTPYKLWIFTLIFPIIHFLSLNRVTVAPQGPSSPTSLMKESRMLPNRWLGWSEVHAKTFTSRNISNTSEVTPETFSHNEPLSFKLSKITHLWVKTYFFRSQSICSFF